MRAYSWGLQTQKKIMYNTIENFLTNFSFLMLFLSMMIYWIEISNMTFSSNFGGIAPPKDAKTSPSFELGGAISVGDSALNRDGNQISFGQYGMLISNISIFFLLLLRWKESGHFPLSNLYESLMFLSWTLTTINIFLDYNVFWGSSFNFGKISNSIPFVGAGDQLKMKIAKYGQNQSKSQLLIPLLNGSITAPIALLTNAFATFSLPKEMQEASPLVPALQSNWLMMHVTVMILSYGALILGSLLSVAFLVITGGNDLLSENGQTELSKLAQTFDNLSYRILGIGFPFLTIGILSGAVWANEAWGSYWSWDPKETWALLTWLVFAIYLHTRLNKGWEGRKPALIATLGLISVWVCYLGVNLLGEGLHSYGWFTKS